MPGMVQSYESKYDAKVEVSEPTLTGRAEQLVNMAGAISSRLVMLRSRLWPAVEANSSLEKIAAPESLPRLLERVEQKLGEMARSLDELESRI